MPSVSSAVTRNDGSESDAHSRQRKIMTRSTGHWVRQMAPTGFHRAFRRILRLTSAQAATGGKMWVVGQGARQDFSGVPAALSVKSDPLCSVLYIKVLKSVSLENRC